MYEICLCEHPGAPGTKRDGPYSTRTEAAAAALHRNAIENRGSGTHRWYWADYGEIPCAPEPKFEIGLVLSAGEDASRVSDVQFPTMEKAQAECDERNVDKMGYPRWVAAAVGSPVARKPLDKALVKKAYIEVTVAMATVAKDLMDAGASSEQVGLFMTNQMINAIGIVSSPIFPVIGVPDPKALSNVVDGLNQKVRDALYYPF